MLKQFCLGAMSVAAVGLLPITMQAAPLSGSELKAGATVASYVDKAAYRRCWWRHGYRVCRWVGYPSYYDDDYGYYGYGPSIGFGFGSGGRHFHGGHGGHHR
jgi:hypothetical protein